MTSGGSGEFVTVAEAARRLGVDPRQVRRYLPRLAPTDRTEDTQRTHKGQPIVRVRLSAVEALRTGNHEKVSISSASNGQDRTAQRTKQRTGQDTREKLSVDAAVAAALVEELRARVTELSTALEHEREAHRRAETLHLGTMGELQELRRRAIQLEAQNARLIEALPASSVQSMGVINDGASEGDTGSRAGDEVGPESPLEDAETSAGNPARISTPPGAPAGDSEEASQRRPWWALWKRA